MEQVSSYKPSPCYNYTSCVHNFYLFHFRCKFACGLCDLVTVDSRQMRLHIATHHSLSMDAYHQEYGTTEIVTRKFRCELPRYVLLYGSSGRSRRFGRFRWVLGDPGGFVGFWEVREVSVGFGKSSRFREGRNVMEN